MYIDMNEKAKGGNKTMNVEALFYATELCLFKFLWMIVIDDDVMDLFISTYIMLLRKR